jgi:hypothetical protein
MRKTFELAGEVAGEEEREGFSFYASYEEYKKHEEYKKNEI